MSCYGHVKSEFRTYLSVAVKLTKRPMIFIQKMDTLCGNYLMTCVTTLME